MLAKKRTNRKIKNFNYPLLAVSKLTAGFLRGLRANRPMLSLPRIPGPGGKALVIDCN